MFYSLLQVRLLHVILDLDLCPLRHILLGVLEQLKMKDPADIFAEPVPLDEVCLCVDNKLLNVLFSVGL